MAILCYLQLTFCFVFMTLTLMFGEQKGVINKTMDRQSWEMNGCWSIYPSFLLDIKNVLRVYQYNWPKHKADYGLGAMVSVKQFVFGCVELDKYNMGVDILPWHLSESSSVYCLSPHTAQVRSKHYSQMICQKQNSRENIRSIRTLRLHHFMNILIEVWTCPIWLLLRCSPRSDVALCWKLGQQCRVGGGGWPELPPPHQPRNPPDTASIYYLHSYFQLRKLIWGETTAFINTHPSSQYNFFPQTNIATMSLSL